MCGIGGVINLKKNSSKLNFNNINIMRKLLKERGPDSDKNWISKNKDVAITVQRLATQDSRSIANQPCLSSDKNIILIMNGEIYNHLELKKILIKKKYKFKSNNDAEVAANAYHLWGQEFLKKLEGQFSIFVFDQKNNSGLIARDEHGISPLYYFNDGKKIIFSSSPFSIFKQIKMKLKLNRKALADYVISGCMTENNTFFEKIKYLSPGHFISFKASKSSSDPKKFISKTYYYNNKFSDFSKSKNLINKIEPILSDNIRLRLNGSKNVGIFLSGGIDSVVLLAIYKKLFPKKRIETFTAVFESGKNKKLVGEHKKVSKICKYFKCKNNLVRINSRELIKHLENSTYPPTGLLEFCFKKLAAKARKNNTEVVLSGEGADEMFFGYDHNLALLGIFKKKFSFLNKKYKLRNLPINKKSLINCKIEDLFLFGGADLNLENNRKKVFSPNVSKTRSLKNTIRNTIKKLNLKNPQDVDKIIINIDYQIKIPELQIRRAEGPAMEKGVEVRFPYLNEQLKSLINSMPLKDKVDKKLVDKILLRKIARKLVPKSLQSEKLPFGLPAVRKKHFGLSKTKFEKPAFNDLFYQNYKKMRKMVLFGKFRKLKLFNNNFLKEIVIRQSEKNKCFFDVKLWRIWSFACWYEKVIK